MIRNPIAAEELLHRVLVEMRRQDVKWGWPRPEAFLALDSSKTCAQSLPGLMLHLEFRSREVLAEQPSWDAILGEELGEVIRAEVPDDRVEELVQVAAVCLSWAQSILESRDEKVGGRG